MDFEQQIEQILSGPKPSAAPQAPQASTATPPRFEDQIEQILAPPAAQPAQDAPFGINIGLGQPQRSAADPAAIYDWVKANPQAITDFLLQSVGTAGGIAGGTVLAGPAGGVAGGAAGNVAGKQLSRRIGTAAGFPDAAPPPEIASLETGVDAVLGAAGPLARSGLRPLARGFTGVTKRNIPHFVERQIDEGQEALAAKAAGDAQSARTLEEAAGTRMAREFGNKASDQVSSLANPLAILSALGTQDLTKAAAVFFGARAAGWTRGRITEALLKQPKFVDWLTNTAPSLNTAEQIGISLTALTSKADADAKRKPERQPVTRSAAGTYHDSLGRFTSPAPSPRLRSAIDHSGHPALEAEEEDQP